MCTSNLVKIKPRLIANIKKVHQRLYASIKMGIFDKSNYIVNTGIIEQFFQCTTKMIRLLSPSLTCMITAAVTPWGWRSSTISSTLQSAMSRERMTPLLELSNLWGLTLTGTPAKVSPPLPEALCQNSSFPVSAKVTEIQKKYSLFDTLRSYATSTNELRLCYFQHLNAVS